MPSTSELADTAVSQTISASSRETDALNRTVVSSPSLPVEVAKPDTNYPVFTAIQDYLSEEDGNLNFKKGDMLYIVSKDEGDWWQAIAKHTGRQGYIPKSYVKKLRASQSESSDVQMSKYPLFVAAYDFSLEENGFLDFKKGDLLYIMNTDKGSWWFAKSMHTGQEGFIPNNYVTEYKSVDAEE